jgi:hypothetical protein
LPFVLGTGITETVTVVSEAPIVDLKATSVSSVVSVEDLVEYIPLGRNFSDMFTLSPGVTSGLQSGNGNFSMSGSSGLENSYLIDGVNITNSGYGGIGSYNRVFGSLGSGVTNDFIDQVEVKEGGFEAEFGQATGGVVNAIVKSGTNTFGGQVTGYLAPNSFESGRRVLNRFPDAITIKEEARNELGLSAGGPIIKDQLFWYAAYNPVESETTFTRTVLDQEALYFEPDFGQFPGTGCPDDAPLYDDALGPGLPGCAYDQEQLGPGRTETRERSNDNYAAKLSWLVTPLHRVEVTAFGDPSDGDAGPQRAAALRRIGNDGYSSLDYGGDNYSVKYFGAITSDLFVDAQLSRHESNLTENPLRDIYSITDLDVAGGLATGGIGFSPDTDEQVDQIALKVTYVWKNHEFKVGYQKDEIEYTEAGRQSGPLYEARLPNAVLDPGLDDWVWDGTYTNFASTTGAFIEQSGGVFSTQRSRFSPVEVLTENEEENFFFQWTYNPIPEVTVKVGARWTEEYVAGGEPFTLPFTVVRPASGAAARPRMVDTTTPSDFNPTALTFPDEWVPRLGVSWDIFGDGKHKVYANYGEYLQRLTQDLAYRAFSNEVDIRQNWLNVLNDGTPVSDFTPDESGLCPVAGGGTENCQIITAATGLGGPTQVFPGTELPKTKEFLLGYSREINPTMALDLRYIHREIDRVIEDFSYVPQEAIHNALWGTGFGVGDFDPFPQFPSEFFGEYVLANPSQNTLDAVDFFEEEGLVPPAIADLYQTGQVSDFPKPRRDYDALQLVLNKRFSDNWVLYGTYRWARLVGNYEGLLRNDNGQDDPNITSLYDFPATPQMAGQFIEGKLNTDVEHNLRVSGSYTFDNGLRVGGSLGWSTGVPRFPLLLHPNDFYQLPANGEVAGTDAVYASWLDRDDDDVGDTLALRQGFGGTFISETDGTTDADGNLIFVPYSAVPGEEVLTNGVTGLPQFLYDYTPVQRDFNGRTPATVNLDLHLAYSLGLRKDTSLTFALDIFNLFNTQEVVLFDDVLELQQGEPNPNNGRPTVAIRAFQEPRTLRFGVRYNF